MQGGSSHHSNMRPGWPACHAADVWLISALCGLRSLCLSSSSKATKFLISHAEREAGLNPDQAGRCKRELIPAAGPNLGEFRENSFVVVFWGFFFFLGEWEGFWRQHFNPEFFHCPKEKETNKSWCLKAKLTKLPVIVVPWLVQSLVLKSSIENCENGDQRPKHETIY